MYSNIKKLIDWTEKYENQLAEGEQWNDANFAKWLSLEVKVNKESEVVLSEKAKPAVNGWCKY